jgi:replication factor A1
MPTITSGVDFDTKAREWRCKWDEKDEKKSLAEVQKALDGVMDKVGAVAGLKNVQRVVCGTCKDFKVVLSLPNDKFDEWEGKSFEPETEFLDAVKKIDGVTAAETQTYTLMPVKFTRPKPPPKLKKAKVFQIGKLKPDAEGFTIIAKVVDECKEVETKGGTKIMECQVGDATGLITCSLKPEQTSVFAKDKVVVFRNARILMVKGHIRLMVDKWGKIEAGDEDDKVETVGDKDVSSTEFELVKGKK